MVISGSTFCVRARETEIYIMIAAAAEAWERLQRHEKYAQKSERKRVRQACIKVDELT